MKRYHYAPKLITTPISSEIQINSIDGIKPKGFWYSIDTEWYDWCKSNDFGLERLRYKYEVDVGSANILKITSTKEILEFQEKYKTIILQTDKIVIHNIDWARVSEDYDGIEVNPYYRNFLFDQMIDMGWRNNSPYLHLWYSTWDIASGCIWLNERTKITLIEEEPINASDA